MYAMDGQIMLDVYQCWIYVGHWLAEAKGWILPDSTEAGGCRRPRLLVLGLKLSKAIAMAEASDCRWLYGQ